MTALYLSDYAPEGGTESASAGLRAAFDALGAQGGGELVIDGTFLLDQNSIQLGEGASKNFNGLANTIVLRGQGSHSVLLLRAGASATALRISTIENLYIENVTFHGSPSAIPDVRKGIYLDGVRTATFIGCNFNAIVAGNGSGAAALAQAAVLHAHDTSLILKSTNFAACGGQTSGWHGGVDAPVVLITEAGGITADDCRWLDIVVGGAFKGVAQAFKRQANAWVWIREPFTAIAGGLKSHTRRSLTFRNCHFDESVGSAILVDNNVNSNRHRSLRVEGCNIASPSANTVNNNGALAAPLLVKGVDDVTVVDCNIGDYGSLATAMQFENCDSVLIEGVTGMAPSTTIVADAACRVLVARNLRGSLSYVQSEARRTEIQDRGLNAHDRTSLLPSPMKYSTIPRMSNVSIQDIIATSGRLYLAAIELPKGFRVQNISFLSASRAAVAPTNQWFGLFDAGRTAVAVTENDTTNPWPANSLKTLALQSPHVTTYTGVYYLGLLVTADTTPNFVAALGNAIYSGIEPVIAASQSTALTAPPPLPYVAPTLVPASQIAFAGVG